MLKHFSCALMSLLMLPAALYAENSPVFSLKQQQAIESIVREYIQKHPELIQKASKPSPSPKTNTNPIITYREALFHDPRSPKVPAFGGEKALVVEFFDYQCGHCKTMKSVMEAVREQNPNVTYIFKELPIFGDQSVFAAKAALAAAKQGKYWQLHQAMLVSDGGLPPEQVIRMARQAGLNVLQLQRDMRDPAIEAELKRNSELARHLHVEGTPSFFLADKHLNRIAEIPGAVSTENLLSSVGDVAGP